uniref:hypothetical protein n=1 Tax=Congregibacter sp. TaxID=2744308 RepID=UPI003F6D17A4
FSPRELLLQQLSDRMGVSRLLKVPGLATLLGPVQQSVEFLDSFADPNHLYMRCVACNLN